MKKWQQILTAAGILTALTAFPVYAAGWQWLDPNGDGISECYYIQDDGTKLTGTATAPDGFTINEQGAWVENGVVQTQGTQSLTLKPSSLDKHTKKTSQLDAFEYYLYSPKNASDNMPLIVYLHGHGTGNMNTLRDDIIFTGFREDDTQKSSAYILAPLLPLELDLGSKGMWPGIEASVMELIESVVSDYKIDRSRIYLTGGSMGADSAIQLAAAHPDTFACLVGVVPFHMNCPIAKWEDAWGEQLKTTPTWLFVEDESGATSKAFAAADAIIAAGGQAWTEVQTGANHGNATRQVALNMGAGRYGIYDWMLSITKPAAQ